MPYNDELPIPLHHAAQKLYNVPQLILPDVAHVISNVFAREVATRIATRSGVAQAQPESADLQVFPPLKSDDGTAVVYAPRASGFVGSRPRDPMTGAPSPYRVTSDGTAIIRIVGELVNRGEWLDASSGFVSYEGLKHQFATAKRDAMVRNVILDMRSPGGEAEGCFDCADALRGLAAMKPVVGFVNGLACSAMYAIASACASIVSTRDGRCGSIGVLMMHVDYSMALAAEGIKPTFLFAGSHKVDGNPYAPLPDEVRARFQSMIDSTYGMFVSTVAMGRKNLTEDSIRATQAPVYSASDALAVGLIDRIGTFEDLLIELAQPDSITVNVTNDGGDDPPTEGNKKQGAASPANTEESMSKLTLVQQLKALLTGAEAEAAAETPPLSAASGTPTPKAGEEAFVGATVQSLAVHFSTAGDKCKAFAAGDRITTDLNMATCGDCLRGEITRAKESAGDANVDANVDATKIIETAADTFVTTHCQNIGKDATAALREEFVAAKTSGDSKRVTRLETIAASYPKERTERVDTSKGPNAADVAGVMNSNDIHFAALDKLAAEGVTDRSSNFAEAYNIAVASIKGGAGVAA